jgi:arylsulfatase A-like enzyme
LVYGPGVEPGVSNYPASLNDLMPTILYYVGIDPPVGISGESLGVVLNGDRNPEGTKLLFTDQLGEKDPSMKSVFLYPYTLIRTGYNTYSYEMVDNRIHKGPDDIVTDPEPDVYGLLFHALDEFASDMEDEARVHGGSVELQFDEDRLHKLKELGYVD